MSIPTLHPYAFDPAYGFGIEALRSIKRPAEPPRMMSSGARYASAFDWDPAEQLRESVSVHPDWRVHDITYTSTGGFQIGGWLLPRLENLRQGDVVMAVGKEDRFVENNRHLSRLLAEKGVQHLLHIWDGRALRAGAWRRVAPLYV